MKEVILTVSPYGNAKDDLFYWIRSYTASKVKSIKQDLGFDIDRGKAFSELLETRTMNEFKEKELEIRNAGLRNLLTYVNPLLGLYDYFCETKSIQQITDFDTEHRDNIFLEKNKDYTYSTNLGHFVQINSLVKYIEKTLSTTKNAKKYTFDIINKIGLEDGKIIHPFPEDTSKLKYIKSDEIFHLLAMANTFGYRRDGMTKFIFMLKLVIFGGLSGRELAHLTKDNVHIIKNPHQLLGGLYLMLQIKHPKETVIYIKYNLIAEEYSTYTLEYHGRNNHELYFYTEDKNIYSSSAIYTQFERLLIHANIRYDNSAASFLKYGYAFFLASNDVDPFIVSLLFGGKAKIMKIYDEAIVEDLRNNPSQIIACWDIF